MTVESDAARRDEATPASGLTRDRELPEVVEAFAGELTTVEPAARVAFAKVVRGVVEHRADTAEHLEAVFALDPDCALAHLVAGFALKLLARRDLQGQIDGRLLRARAAMAERRLGAALVEAGYGIVCGGMGGLMAAACKGAGENKRCSGAIDAQGQDFCDPRV